MNNFIDNLINTFEIDNKEELENLIYTCITIYYYADIELVILKRNFEAKTKEEIKNSDIFDLISLITPKKKDRYKSFKTDILTTEDRRIIYHDISILKKLRLQPSFKQRNSNRKHYRTKKINRFRNRRLFKK